MEFNQINLTTHDHVDRRIINAVLGGVALMVAAFTLINGIQWISKYSERSRYQAKISELQQLPNITVKTGTVVARIAGARTASAVSCPLSTMRTLEPR